MVPLVVVNFATGTLLCNIFEKWAGIRAWLTGATTGATIGALIALSFDSMIHGTTTLMSWGGVALGVVVSAILWGVTGAVIGW